MGRGDKKSKKGKIALGSFGVSRRKKVLKARSRRLASRKPAAAPAETAPVVEAAKPKRTVRKKTEA